MQISKGVRWFAHGSFMLVAVYLGSTYLIDLGTSPTKPKASPKTETKYDRENQAKFRSLLDTGNTALQAGHYAEALASYGEAERSLEELSDAQYESLKKGRLSVAQSYELSGNTSGAEEVYRTLTDCAIREARALIDRKESERAASRAQDAEQFADNLMTDKRQTLHEARSLLASAFTSLQRYPEAEAAQQRTIDFVKSSAEDYDPDLSQGYLGLAMIYQEAKDWSGMEQALTLAKESCDRTVAYYTSFNDRDQASNDIVGQALTAKNMALYGLVTAYYRDHNFDAALSAADEFFSFASYEEFPPRIYSQSRMQPNTPAQMAQLAVQIATEAGRQDALNLWQSRLGQTRPGIAVAVVPR